MFKFLISFIIGMILIDFIQLEWLVTASTLILIFTTLYLILTAAHKHVFYKSLLVHLALVLLGYTHGSTFNSHTPTINNIETGQPVLAAILIENFPKPRTQNIVSGKIMSINHQSLRYAQPIELYSKESMIMSLKPRDTIIAKVIVQETHEPSHKYAFNYAQHLKKRNISYQGWIQKVHVYAPCQLYEGIDIITIGWRSKAIRSIKEHLSEPHASIIAALLVGYRNDIDQDLQKQFANSGAIHVLAVSGLHVGIIFAILKFCLWWLPRRGRFILVESMILSLGLILYALFTGQSAPVMRSTLIFLIFIWNRHVNRHTNSLNLLASAAFFILILDPSELSQISFQLSFAAVGGIILFYHKIYRAWSVTNILLDYLWSLTAVSIAAQVFILPLSLYYFHQFPVYFIISSIIAILCAFMIIAMGLPILALGQVIPEINGILVALEPLVEIILRSTRFIDGLYGSIFKVIWFENIHLFLLFLTLLSGIIWLRVKQFRWLQLSMFSIITFFAYCNYNLFNQKSQFVISTYEQDEGVTDILIGQKAFEIVAKELTPHKKIFITRDFRHGYGIKEVHPAEDLEKYLKLINNE